MGNVKVFSSVYKCYLREEEAIYSSYYRAYIPREDAFFCYFDSFDSFITEYDPRFESYFNEGNKEERYAKPWYKFNEFGFHSLVNSQNTITILGYDYNKEDFKIKAIVKFKDTKKYEEFKSLEDKRGRTKFLRSYTTMGGYYTDNIEIDILNDYIKKLSEIFNPYKLSKKEYNAIKQEINNADFFVII